MRLVNLLFWLLFAVVAIVVVGVVVAALTGEPKRTIRAQATITAPPEAVWKVLSRLDAYDEWNPFIVNARGALREGQTLTLTLRPPGEDETDFKPDVETVDEDRRMTWESTSTIPGVLDGVQDFTIEPLSSGRVRLVIEWKFSGVYALVFPGLDNYERGIRDMARAVETQAERLQPPR